MRDCRQLAAGLKDSTVSSSESIQIITMSRQPQPTMCWQCLCWCALTVHLACISQNHIIAWVVRETWGLLRESGLDDPAGESPSPKQDSSTVDQSSPCIATASLLVRLDGGPDLYFSRPRAQAAQAVSSIRESLFRSRLFSCSSGFHEGSSSVHESASSQTGPVPQ